MSDQGHVCCGCDAAEMERALRVSGAAIILTLTAERDEARAERNAERMARDADFEEMARLRAKLYRGGMCNVNHDTMNERLDAARALAAETVAWFDNQCHDGGPKSSCAACVLHARWRDWSGPE